MIRREVKNDSVVPVEAPDGTAALKRPLEVVRSTSTVGFPRESKICLAWILRIALDVIAEISKFRACFFARAFYSFFFYFICYYSRFQSLGPFFVASMNRDDFSQFTTKKEIIAYLKKNGSEDFLKYYKLDGPVQNIANSKSKEVLISHCKDLHSGNTHWWVSSYYSSATYVINY